MTKEPAKGLIRRPDGSIRCWWPGDNADYIAYHDGEWGRPLADDHRLYEKICLEGFQCGLSWITILRKRENFRRAFANFDYRKVLDFDDEDVERLAQDSGIIRNKPKIRSTINNAARAIEMEQEFGSLAAYFWQWEPEPKTRPKRLDHATLMKLDKTARSTALSRDLKKRGWSYVGPTTVYAFMQTAGLVNDHIEGCETRVEVETLRKKFKRPQYQA